MAFILCSDHSFTVFEPDFFRGNLNLANGSGLTVIGIVRPWTLLIYSWCISLINLGLTAVKWVLQRGVFYIIFLLSSYHHLPIRGHRNREINFWSDKILSRNWRTRSLILLLLLSVPSLLVTIGTVGDTDLHLAYIYWFKMIYICIPSRFRGRLIQDKLPAYQVCLGMSVESLSHNDLPKSYSLYGM